MLDNCLGLGDIQAHPVEDIPTVAAVGEEVAVLGPIQADQEVVADHKDLNVMDLNIVDTMDASRNKAVGVLQVVVGWMFVQVFVVEVVGRMMLVEVAVRVDLVVEVWEAFVAGEVVDLAFDRVVADLQEEVDSFRDNRDTADQVDLDLVSRNILLVLQVVVQVLRVDSFVVEVAFVGIALDLGLVAV